MIKSCLLSWLLIALITQFGVAKLDAKVKSEIENSLLGIKNHQINTALILSILEKNSLFSKYKVKSSIELGTKGLIFDVDDNNENLVAEIIVDENKDYPICKNEETNQKVSKKKIIFVNNIQEHKKTSIKVDKINFYYCVQIFEKIFLRIDDSKIFWSFDSVSNKLNSKKLFRLLGKTILAFAELNFKAKILHGNIKPENIMVKYKKNSNHFDKEFDPVVINFSKMLENNTKKDLPDQVVRYSLGYFPPELDRKISIVQLYNDPYPRYVSENYKYSKDFLEDVYALGKTIENLLKIHAKYIIETQCEIKKLIEISNEMTQHIPDDDETSEPNSGEKPRPNMKEVLTKFIAKMKECDPNVIDLFNKEFLDQANASLKSLPNILVI